MWQLPSYKNKIPIRKDGHPLFVYEEDSKMTLTPKLMLQVIFQNPYSRKRKPTPINCSLTPISMPWYIHFFPPNKYLNKWVNKNSFPKSPKLTRELEVNLSFGLMQLASTLLLLNITCLCTKWHHMSVNETRCIKLVMHILTGFTFLFVFIFFRLNAETILRKAKRFESTQFYQFQTNFSYFSWPLSILSHFPQYCGILTSIPDCEEQHRFSPSATLLPNYVQSCPTHFIPQEHLFLTTEQGTWYKKEVLISTKNQISKTTPYHIGQHQFPSPQEKKKCNWN